MSRKGSLHEREAVEEYKKRGWKVFKPQKTSKYGTQDIFNMFDFVAISPDGSEIDFVQVKTKSTRGFLKKLKEWGEKHKVKKVNWVLMVRLDARKYKTKWRKYQ